MRQRRGGPRGARRTPPQDLGIGRSPAARSDCRPRRLEQSGGIQLTTPPTGTTITVTGDQHDLIVDALAYAQAVTTAPDWSADVRPLVNDLFDVRCPSCQRLLELANPDGDDPRWQHISQYEATACRQSRRRPEKGKPWQERP